MPLSSITSPLVRPTEHGLYCAAGDFFIDPWRKVDRAVVTHAHSDHARPGMEAYLCANSGAGVLRERVGESAAIEGLAFGETRKMGGVTVSLHPAGHLLGSAQVRLEHKGEVWVITGDYKRDADTSCEAFQPVPCHTIITESTFGLPVYRWPTSAQVFQQINDWWRENQREGRTSVLYAYALGKAQRVLCGLDPSIGPIGVHGAVDRMLPHYRAEGRPIPPSVRAVRDTKERLRGAGLIVAPGSARNTPWLRQFAPHSQAFASGWMAVRGGRRRMALDRGFVLSDHVDWNGILQTVEDCGAERVGVTHGYAGPLMRWLREEKGLEAYEVPTRFVGESAEESGDSAEEE